MRERLGAMLRRDISRDASAKGEVFSLSEAATLEMLLPDAATSGHPFSCSSRLSVSVCAYACARTRGRASNRTCGVAGRQATVRAVSLARPRKTWFRACS